VHLGVWFSLASKFQRQIKLTKTYLRTNVLSCSNRQKVHSFSLKTYQWDGEKLRLQQCADVVAGFNGGREGRKKERRGAVLGSVTAVLRQDRSQIGLSLGLSLTVLVLLPAPCKEVDERRKVSTRRYIDLSAWRNALAVSQCILPTYLVTGLHGFVHLQSCWTKERESRSERTERR